MPRQFGKVDVSTGWPPCPDCPYRHMPGSPCPGGGWLVLAMCGKCKPKTGAYCRFHGGHVQPVPDVPHALSVPDLDVQQRRTGEAADG